MPRHRAFVLRLIGLDIRKVHGSQPPGVVDEKLGIDAKQPVQQFLL